MMSNFSVWLLASAPASERSRKMKIFFIYWLLNYFLYRNVPVMLMVIIKAGIIFIDFRLGYRLNKMSSLKVSTSVFGEGLFRSYFKPVKTILTFLPSV